LLKAAETRKNLDVRQPYNHHPTNHRPMSVVTYPSNKEMCST